MLLLLIIIIGLCTVSGAIVVWMELSVVNDSLMWLEERLDKLEKDAVKITFSEPPLFHPKPKTQTDYQNEHGKEFETKIIEDIKSRGLYTEDKKKSNPKQFDGIKSEEPFVKTRTKRKPKTTKDWEDEFDLGGHE